MKDNWGRGWPILFTFLNFSLDALNHAIDLFDLLLPHYIPKVLYGLWQRPLSRYVFNVLQDISPIAYVTPIKIIFHLLL